MLVFTCFKRVFGSGMDFELYLVLGHYLGDHGRAGLPAGDLRLLLPQPEHRAEPGHRLGLKNLKDHKGIRKAGGCVTITKCSTLTEPFFSARNPVIGPHALLNICFCTFYEWLYFLKGLKDNSLRYRYPSIFKRGHHKCLFSFFAKHLFSISWLYLFLYPGFMEHLSVFFFFFSP